VQGKISFGKVIFSKSPIASSIGNVIGSNNNINLTLNVGIQQNTGSQTNGQITYATPKEVIEMPADVSVGSEAKNDLVVDETDARDKDNVIIVHDESEGEDAQKVEAREKRPRSSSNSATESRQEKMIRIENAVSKSLGYEHDTFQKHREVLTERLRKQEESENPDTVVIAALKFNLSQLREIWKNSCDETWVGEDPEVLPADVVGPSDDKTLLVDKKSSIKLELAKKVPRYTLAQTIPIVQFHNECMNSADPSHREEKYWLAIIRSKQGYEKIAAKTVTTWAAPGGLDDNTGKGGRRRNHGFALAVFPKLVVKGFNDYGREVIEANVMFNYDIIQ
jgi:hypothetical protein